MEEEDRQVVQQEEHNKFLRLTKSQGERDTSVPDCDYFVAKVLTMTCWGMGWGDPTREFITGRDRNPLGSTTF